MRQPGDLSCAPRLSANAYNMAIQAIEYAKSQLEPDGRVCAICGDTGHQAWECHHNPLAMMREARRLEGAYRCFHCGEVFFTEEDAAEHFGPRAPQREPACVSSKDGE